MKKFLVTLFLGSTLAFMSGCDRVEPNQAGVLMQNYGKNGKEDFSIVSGRVWTAAPGTDLYTIPLFEQRGQFPSKVVMKSGNGTEFEVQPTYSYRVIKSRAIDVIFDNKQILSGDNSSMVSIQENILNPKITDLLRTAVLSKTSDELMKQGGNEEFNSTARKLVADEFNRRGFELISFSAMLDYSARVKAIIDERNQANTQISTIDSKIEQAKKDLELQKIATEINMVRSQGLTPEILQQKAIERWNGQLPMYISSKEDISFLMPAAAKK